MSLNEIAHLRLINQHITGSQFSNIKQLVGWMGALQAQDYYMMKWAIGIRLPGISDTQVEEAMDQGEIIRTHLLRPTWHIVSSDDIYWMLDLTSPQIIRSLKSRHAELGLTTKVLSKCFKTIETALTDVDSLTREELSVKLSDEGIPAKNEILSHIMFSAELAGIVCNGPSKENKRTYALLEKIVPVKKSLPREEALALLTKKYYQSHGPATLYDFAWWSGLTTGNAKLGLEMNKSNLKSKTINNETYWFSESSLTATIGDKSVILLPAFDEYIISYRNRDVVITEKNYSKAVSNNGIFRPVILINGQASGLWKRTIKKDKVIIEPDLFHKLNKEEKVTLKQAANAFGLYLNKKTEIIL